MGCFLRYLEVPSGAGFMGVFDEAEAGRIRVAAELLRRH